MIVVKISTNVLPLQQQQQQVSLQQFNIIKLKLTYEN